MFNVKEKNVVLARDMGYRSQHGSQKLINIYHDSKGFKNKISFTIIYRFKHVLKASQCKYIYNDMFTHENIPLINTVSKNVLLVTQCIA